MTNGKLLPVLFLSLSTSLVCAQEFYRYVNDQGQTVLDTKIPGQFVNNGYDVLDSGGRLLERVPAVVTQDPAEMELSAAASSNAQEDQILLASYSRVEEIDAHGLRKVEALEREISIIQTDQRVTQIEIDKAVQEKADYEAREFEVPPETLAHIEELNVTMVRLEEQLARRSAEIEATEVEFLGKRERFIQLKAELDSN
ncbi:MAG: hypothetical protein HOL48_07410 [Porticoccaceae bacterium]|jgi:hypothetical protein|nr:hypothetical protein [Porticoccaceae bacterium]